MRERANFLVQSSHLNYKNQPWNIASLLCVLFSSAPVPSITLNWIKLQHSGMAFRFKLDFLHHQPLINRLNMLFAIIFLPGWTLIISAICKSLRVIHLNKIEAHFDKHLGTAASDSLNDWYIYCTTLFDFDFRKTFQNLFDNGTFKWTFKSVDSQVSLDSSRFFWIFKHGIFRETWMKIC